MKTNWRNLYAISIFVVSFLVPPFHSPLTHAWLRFILILLYDKFLKLLEAVGRERCNKNNRGERALVLIITLTPNDFHQSCKHAPKQGLTRLLPSARSLAPQGDTEWEQTEGTNTNLVNRAQTGKKAMTPLACLYVDLASKQWLVHIHPTLMWNPSCTDEPKSCQVLLCFLWDLCVPGDSRSSELAHGTQPAVLDSAASGCLAQHRRVPVCTKKHSKHGLFCNKQFAQFCALHWRDKH